VETTLAVTVSGRAPRSLQEQIDLQPIPWAAKTNGRFGNVAIGRANGGEALTGRNDRDGPMGDRNSDLLDSGVGVDMLDLRGAAIGLGAGPMCDWAVAPWTGSSGSPSRTVQMRQQNLQHAQTINCVWPELFTACLVACHHLLTPLRAGLFERRQTSVMSLARLKMLSTPSKMMRGESAPVPERSIALSPPELDPCCVRI
jgi:hypothetical protein